MVRNFVDFRKAVDCIHRGSLWAIGAKYRIPNKLINIMIDFYRGTRCAVRVYG